MSLNLTPEEFERIVIDELDELPDEMVDGLENVVFVCEDRPEEGEGDPQDRDGAQVRPGRAARAVCWRRCDRHVCLPGPDRQVTVKVPDM